MLYKLLKIRPNKCVSVTQKKQNQLGMVACTYTRWPHTERWDSTGCVQEPSGLQSGEFQDSLGQSKNLSQRGNGDWRVARWLKALTVLQEDLGSVPSMYSHNCLYWNWFQQVLIPSYSLFRYCMHILHKTHANKTSIHIKLKINKFQRKKI